MGIGAWKDIRKPPALVRGQTRFRWLGLRGGAGRVRRGSVQRRRKARPKTRPESGGLLSARWSFYDAGRRAPIVDVPWSGSTRDPGSNRWGHGTGRRRAGCFALLGRHQTWHCGDGSRTSPRRGRVLASACNADAIRTSRTRPPAGRTIPRAKQTAAFWQSLDALALRQKLAAD